MTRTRRPTNPALYALLLVGGCATTGTAEIEPIRPANVSASTVNPIFMLGMVGGTFTTEGNDWLSCGQTMITEISTTGSTKATNFERTLVRIVCPIGAAYQLNCDPQAVAMVEIHGPTPTRGNGPTFDIFTQSPTGQGFWQERYNKANVQMPHLGGETILFRPTRACELSLLPQG